MLRRALVSLAAVAAALQPAVAAEPFRFGVLGDIPYNRFERQHLPRLLAEMDAEGLRVVVHDGDLKNGGERCDDALYADRLALFEASHTPFVFVPGDNDWTDCHRNNNGGYDPVERLARLREVFFARPGQTLGRYPLAVDSQAGDAAFGAYREHLRWQIGPVLFVTLNVPGGGSNIGRPAQPNPEFVERSAALRAWISAAFSRARARKLEGVVLILQANPDLEAFSAGRASRGYRELLGQLLAESKGFAGEVLLVHGDSHVHRFDQPLRDPTSGRLQANFTRLETWGSPFMGWVKVDVTPGEKPLFRVTPRIYTPGN